MRGIEAETFIEICRAYVRALAEEASNLTPTQNRRWQLRPSVFLASYANVGLIALIDEATGYHYDRAQDALFQVKLKAFLEG